MVGRLLELLLQVQAAVALQVAGVVWIIMDWQHWTGQQTATLWVGVVSAAYFDQRGELQQPEKSIFRQR